jgi:hypothetical protein
MIRFYVFFSGMGGNRIRDFHPCRCRRSGDIGRKALTKHAFMMRAYRSMIDITGVTLNDCSGIITALVGDTM